MSNQGSIPDVFIHPTAQVESGAAVGAGTRVWSNVQIRSGAVIGRNCIFGRNSFVDVDVVVGDNVKVQNNASLFEGVTLEDGVFIGPHVVFTNDKVPRAVNPDGTLKSADDWTLGSTIVHEGAALGAGTIVVTGVSIGRWAMIGSGTVVTKSVPDHALLVGNPGRIVGWVSAAGVRCDDQASAIARSEVETTKSAADTGRDGAT
jgi:acetyltransferase-like isoleucine patch superfamily enzyme